VASGEQENPPGSNFCLGCGARLGSACASCDMELSAGSRFCNRCGTPVQGETGVSPHLASPASYTPRHLAEKILTSRAALDQSSMELIEHLFPLVEKVPLLLCSVSRPEAGTSAAQLREIARERYGTRYTEAVLAPLSAEDSGTLLEGLLGTSDVSPRLRELVLAKTEGNPLFMEEVVRSLIALGVLAPDESSGAWRALAAVEEARIPDTIQGVIMARVDRLDEDVKQVLKLAAVIGRSFFYRVLRALAETDRKLDERLAELQGVELIRERRRLPELEYIFKHALVQEATYASILVERRRQLHRRVAECLEELFADRLEEFYGCSPTTTRWPRSGRRRRTIFSRPATKPVGWRPMPRPLRTTVEPSTPTGAPSAIDGTHSSAPCSNARLAKRCSAAANTSRRWSISIGH